MFEKQNLKEKQHLQSCEIEFRSAQIFMVWVHVPWCGIDYVHLSHRISSLGSEEMVNRAIVAAVAPPPFRPE
jgi:hypothetical protein